MAGGKRDELAHPSKGYDRCSNESDRVEEEERDHIEMQNRDEEKTLQGTSPNGNAGGQEEKSEQKSLSACSKKPIIVLGIGIIIVIGIGISIGRLLFTKAVQTGTPVPLNCQKDCPPLPCPPDWIGYRGYCYKLSEEEKNWTDSQNFCVSHNASLAKITEENMGIMRMFTRDRVFWVGLKRVLVHLWNWPDGENATMEIMGNGGDCAYLDHDVAVMSVRCSSRHYFICQKKCS